jgi:hypothetical protein
MILVFDYFQIPAELELLILRAVAFGRRTTEVNQLRGEAIWTCGTGESPALSRSFVSRVERWHRYCTPCALLLLDIDHMKRINDTYGHPAGDLVIREIAETLARACRGNDTAARLGGEEFALLCANVN